MGIKLQIKKIKDINAARPAFIVPEYQRGYRWTRKEVKRLLKDIPTQTNYSGSHNYCLQPVVVRYCDNNTYELIDGQQRLTTLFIIQKIISSKLNGMAAPQYTIRYTTREKSADHLNSIEKTYLDPDTATCQDFWFMNEAAAEVGTFIEGMSDVELFALSQRITEQLEVIWYMVDGISDSEAIELFERLNIGKIPLTNSELVKALFLRESAKQFSKERAEEVSLLWDQIEIQLNDENFWGFLCINSDKEYETRIDLILDLIANTPEGKNVDPLYTFFYFNDKIEAGEDIASAWQKIHETYMTLLGWFNNSDHKVFHLIGFLIASRLMKLKEIYALIFDANGNKRGMKAFQKELVIAIIDKLYNLMPEDYKSEEETTREDFIKRLDLIADPEHLQYYSYDIASHKAYIHHILLLYNILGENNADDNKRMFPIARHLKEKWTLEHIHAQHSDLLSTNEQIKSWLITHIPLLLSRQAEKELIDNMQCLLDDINNKPQTPNTRERYKEIYSQVWPIFNGSAKEIHDISNLTLLSQEQNSAVSNYVFEAKRDLISAWDSNGKYIPWGTRRVFFKNFRGAENRQIDFWSEKDRENYLNEICSTIKTLLY